MARKTLIFTYNWNGKLNPEAKAFTTLRLSNRFHIGEEVEIFLKDESQGLGIITAKRELYLSEINPFIAYIDTGYSVKECQDILKRMYSKRGITWEVQHLYFYLIVRKK